MGNVFNLLNGIFFASLLIVAAALFYQKRKKKNTDSPVDSAPDINLKQGYNIESVQDFLDFDKIYKNMIIRGKGTKFTMVVNCSGINYDLMSGEEKVMVEEAFIELLNFIQFPMQIYVQTRKVDLKDSLKTYSQKIKTIENDLKVLVDEYNALKSEVSNDEERLSILAYEIKRKQNLLEYAVDLKQNIDNMSINKNILQYKYYVVITYHIEELGMMTNFTNEEILEMAYAELNTKCHSVIGALMGCDIESRILDANGLAELLYVAFNRDDAELCRLKDNMEAGFYRLFSTTKNAMSLKQRINNLGVMNIEDELALFNQEFELSKLSDAEGLEDKREIINA